VEFAALIRSLDSRWNAHQQSEEHAATRLFTSLRRRRKGAGIFLSL